MARVVLVPDGTPVLNSDDLLPRGAICGALRLAGSAMLARRLTFSAAAVSLLAAATAMGSRLTAEGVTA